MAEPRCLFNIDTFDRVSFISATAVELVLNCGRGAWLSNVDVGQPMLDCVAGFENQQLLDTLYNRVRVVGASVAASFRCDSDDTRRLVSIEFKPLQDGSIQHWIQPIWTEHRGAPIELLMSDIPRDGRSLNCCTWCKRVQLGQGTWEEVEDAQVILHLVEEPSLPSLRAAVCSTCKASLLQAFPARVA